MKLDPPNDNKSQDFLKRSSLYQEFLAEREEILRHKWIESEKAGKDIGFERALLDWIRNHRDGWRVARRTGRFPAPSRRGTSEESAGDAEKTSSTGAGKRSS
jgi:hypothetical protein